MLVLNNKAKKIATKIVMKEGMLYSYNPLDIQYVLINDKFYTIEEVYDYLIDYHKDKIYLYGYYGSYIVPCRATDGRKYLRSVPEQGLMDNILKLPRTILDKRKKINMEIDDINIEEFGKKFSETYSFLYEHTDVDGYDGAVDTFDNLIKNSDEFKNILKDFNDYRQDFIAGDREAASFIFALREFCPKVISAIE